MTEKNSTDIQKILAATDAAVMHMPAGADTRLGRLVNRREWMTIGAVILHNAQRRGRSVVEVHEALILMFGVEALHEILATDYDAVIRWLVEDQN